MTDHNAPLPNQLTERVGAKLRHARELRRWKRADVVAKLVGTPATNTLATWEYGTRLISLPRLLELCELYNLDAGPLIQQRSTENQQGNRYTVEEIGERDDWICGLCETPVDPIWRYPDPRAPSIDHIQPLSDHGTDTRDNVRMTHWGCNHERNASMELTTLDDARRSKQKVANVFERQFPEFAEQLVARLDPESMLRASRERHSPQRYRDRLARRIERFEREGR
ncbi:HNH endonuclease [Amycolatopsis palatopharyngis]|uniref:HNH endonuclease n=1 Tax=Amycolatopsis palatopharyngis TaxID=187982 RepID=UPI000E24BF4B|nr:HNH endonuclease [Amycolatopsis palatopharyngis]